MFNKKILLVLAGASIFFFTINLSFPSFAGNVVKYNKLATKAQTSETSTTEAQTATEEKSVIPTSVPQGDFPGELNIDDVVANAGLLELGENNIPPDPILNSTPWIHYRFTNTANVPILTTESLNQTYLYDKNGFSRLFLSHNSATPMDRYYFRTYTRNSGWTPWTISNEISPSGEDKVQAIQIRAKGYVTKRADIYYKAVLNDGTVLGWAKNGQTVGNIGGDRYIVALKISLWNKDVPFTAATSPLTQSEHYDGMYIDENGSVQYSTANGTPYTGWVRYNNDEYYFKDGVKLTSWQYIDGYKYFFGEDGKLDKDLEDNIGLTNDYQIKYNKATRTMYIMARDGANGYIIPFKTFNSTSGPATPLGTYKTYAKYRWKFMHGNIYCQFLTRFNGPYLIHSILYEGAPTSYNLDSATYNGMDVAQSAGCIRLLSGDAAWVYHNVPLHSAITVYEDRWNKGPVEKSAIEMPIPKSQTFDPTDPVIVAKMQANVEEAKRLAAEEEAAAKAALEAKNNGDAGERAY